ncbi:MAG: 50S ribosomal protein L9 [Planctomycetes bacterium]|nr:50S ribosomal protein L9 [Planctomycetota bacterium]
MRIMLKKNVPNLGMIGDVVNVKDGYARNYLLPYGLADEPTEANLKAVEAAKKAYLEELAREKAQIQARAKLVDGKEVTISARANEEGHLYGSVGPAQIVEALAKENLHVEEKNVVLDEPFHTLDKYEVTLAFGHDITASITVWVVPVREEGTEAPAGEPEKPAEA